MTSTQVDGVGSGRSVSQHVEVRDSPQSEGKANMGAPTAARPLPITLIRPGWPAGVCPIHMFERRQRCGVGCMAARVELAVIEADYLKYWGGLQ